LSAFNNEKKLCAKKQSDITASERLNSSVFGDQLKMGSHVDVMTVQLWSSLSVLLGGMFTWIHH